MADQNDNTAPLHETLSECAAHLEELADVAQAAFEAEDVDLESVLRVVERELRRLSGVAGECAGRADPMTREEAQAILRAGAGDRAAAAST